MKKLYFVLLLLCSLTTFGQAAKKELKNQIVEASCGQCQFGMKAKGCDLAIRVDGKTYFVTGTKIDQHGDAHAADGFCNAIRQAKVSGTIEGDKFVATAFVLLPAKE